MGVHNLKTGWGFLLFIMTPGRILILLAKTRKIWFSFLQPSGVIIFGPLKLSLISHSLRRGFVGNKTISR